MKEFYIAVARYEPKLENELLTLAVSYNSHVTGIVPGGDAESAARSNTPDLAVLTGNRMVRQFMFSTKDDLLSFTGDSLALEGLESVVIQMRKEPPTP